MTTRTLGAVLLPALALLVWAAVGAPTWWPALCGAGAPAPVWVLLYAAFPAALVLARRPTTSAGVRLALLAFQAVDAAVLAWIGMPHFEGALLAVVAAQTPEVVAPRAAIAWAIAQAAPLGAIILPTHGTFGTLKSVGEYLAFSAFAMAAVAAVEREAAARRELAVSHGALLGTQVLLLQGAREDERLRLVREVHDAIGHGLTAAGLQLQIAERTKSPEAVAAAQEAVRTALAELRGLVGAMRGAGPSDLGAALRALGAGVREPQVIVEAPKEIDVGSAERAQALFRSVQEALTNAFKHASARSVRIEVIEDDAGVVATVSDDGRGAGAIAAGQGIEGIRARIAELGGEVTIDTRAGSGFSVRIRLPREAR